MQAVERPYAFTILKEKTGTSRRQQIRSSASGLDQITGKRTFPRSEKGH